MVIRLGVMPWSFHPWEGHTWINLGADLKEGRNSYRVAKDLSLQVSSRPPGSPGYALFYEYVAYPPVWPLIIYPFYLVVSPERVDFAFGGSLPDPLSPLAKFMLKLPLVAFDFAVAFALFRICKHLDIRRPWLAVFLWLFNPLVFLISAVWGHFESIVVFFVLAALWAFFKGRHTLSALSLGLAISTKMFPILLVPVLLYGVSQREGLAASLRYGAITAAVIIGVSLPFALQDFSAFANILTFHRERLGVGMTYYNFAWLAHVAWGKSPLLWGLNFTNLYLPIMLWALTLTYLWVLRLNVFESRRMLEACATVLLVFFATTKLVNEPYAVWVLPFFLLISLYDTRLRLPVYLITAVPLLFIAINVPWPNLFLPYILDTWIVDSSIGFMRMSPTVKFVSLFILGTGFSLLCVSTAMLLIWRAPPRGR